MKAWTFSKRGPPSQVLKFRHDLPQPQQSDLKWNEVIVKVSHVALFAPQASLMAGIPHFNSNLWIPAWEFAGKIAAVADASPLLTNNDLHIDDAVFGMLSLRDAITYNGVLAEYVVVPRHSVVLKPNNVRSEEVVGLSGVGSTAIGYAELANMLEIRQTAEGPSISSKAHGQRILVTGGSTGTGITMIQFFRYLVGENGHIVATASPRNTDAVRGFGADEIIDYKQFPKLSAYLEQHYSTKPFDAIFDISGSDELLYSKSPAYLKPSGCFAFAGKMAMSHSTADASGIIGMMLWLYGLLSTVIGWTIAPNLPVVLGGVPRKSFFHSGRPNARNLELVRQLVEAGTITGVVDSLWKMEDVLQAFEHMAHGNIRGKVVVEVATA